MTDVTFASVFCFIHLWESVSIRKIIEIRVKTELISVKFKVYIKFSITKGLFIEIFFVLLQRTIIAMFIVIEVRRVLSWWHTRQPTPCWVWRSHNDKAVQSGHWVGNVVQTYWRRLLDAVFETLWNLANSTIIVLNIDDGRCPGCDYITPVRPCWHELYLFGYNDCLSWSPNGKIIHIGVGSDVVCSTIIGNARASEGGIDNRRFHALFYVYIAINEQRHRSRYERIA